ncbi:Abi-alpha family protein [Entomobacter blattae]|uniref:DUF4393 domain-containing protein n=1 Tax=Entomobacter blattae TaxID=2762277 RepID=A0A7H1NUG7_9PROT|nr:Abi-alpha family protein [Entomobacter blattae]QNT79427.1 hypothetical protein JGUZn3_22260 [Entomobacter blattae]
MDPISTAVTIFKGYKNIKIASEITQKAYKVLQPIFAHFIKENAEKALRDPYFKHTIDVVQRAMDDLEKEGIDINRITDTNPEIIIEILEQAKNESNDELQDLWAKLLITAIVDKGKNFRKQFIEIVKKLNPLDALYLNILYNMYLLASNNSFENKYTTKTNSDFLVLQLNKYFEDSLNNYSIDNESSVVIVQNLKNENLIEFYSDNSSQSNNSYFNNILKDKILKTHSRVQYNYYILSPLAFLLMKTLSPPTP